MTECQDAELRDMLPDHAHGTLTAAAHARVNAHLATCAACREELALLRAVRVARPRPIVPDVARIVAALPRPVGTSAPGVASLDAHRARRAPVRGLPWRRVAGVAALLVGVAGVGILGRGRGQPVGDDTTGIAAVVEPLVVGPDRRAGGAVTPARPDTPAAVATRTPSRPRQPVPRAVTTDALGALGGVASGATDDELEALIGGLDSLTGIPDVEEAEESAQRGARE